MKIQLVFRFNVRGTRRYHESKQQFFNLAGI